MRGHHCKATNHRSKLITHMGTSAATAMKMMMWKRHLRINSWGSKLSIIEGVPTRLLDSVALKARLDRIRQQRHVGETGELCALLLSQATTH